MLCALLLLSSLTTVVATREPAELKDIKETGAVFEKIGHTVTYRNHWTVFTQISIPPWDQILKFIDLSEHTLEDLCNKISHAPDTTNCKHWTAEINFRKNRIKEKIEEIHIYTQVPSLRKKRGLINVGGTIAKFLFGTMDHEDAEQINEKISELESSKQTGIDVAKHQLTLLKTNTELWGKSLTNLTNQQNLLVEKTNRFNNLLSNALTNATHEIQHVHIMAEMNEISLFILNEVQKIEEQLTTLFFILESLQRKELSPLILSSKEFNKFYKVLSNSEEQNQKLDFTIAKFATKVYSQKIQEKILIKILIPILEKPIFCVNKIYRIPIPLNDGTFSLMDDLSDYYFNSTFWHRDFELSETGFQKNCLATNASFFICKLFDPIRITPKEQNCLQNLFKHSLFDFPNCKHRSLINFDSFLVPMHHENSWLFWMHHPMSLYSQCPNELYTLTLQKSGILKLLRPCVFRLGEFIIPFKPYALYNLSFHQPALLKPPELEKYKEILKIPTIRSKNIDILDSSALRSTLQTNSKTIDTLESEISQIEASKSTKILHIKFNSLAGTIGSILTLIGLFLLIKKLIRTNKQQPSFPAETIRSRVEYISNPIIIPRRNEILNANSGSTQNSSEQTL